MNRKDKLIESTLLALQGRLNLQELKKVNIKTAKQKKTEDVEIETDDAEVTVGENTTIIDTDEATVTVEKNTEECVDGECKEDVDTEDIVDTETFDETPLSGESNDEDIINNEENVETIEVPVEGEETIVPEEDIITDTDEATEPEDNEEEEVEESKEIKTEDTDPRPNETKMCNLINDEIVDTASLAKELLGFLSDDDIGRFMEIEEYNNLTESKECTEDCEKQEEECDKEGKEECNEPISKFSSKTFNEALTKMYKSKYKTIESFKTTKVNLGKNTLKIEGKIVNKDGLEKNICLEMKKIKQTESFIRYEMKNYTGLLKESKNSTLKMVTRVNKDNILECKYIITK